MRWSWTVTGAFVLGACHASALSSADGGSEPFASESGADADSDEKDGGSADGLAASRDGDPSPLDGEACSGWSFPSTPACEACVVASCTLQACQCSGDPIFIGVSDGTEPACMALARCLWFDYLSSDAGVEASLPACKGDGGQYGAGSVGLATALATCSADRCAGSCTP